MFLPVPALVLGADERRPCQTGSKVLLLLGQTQKRQTDFFWVGGVLLQTVTHDTLGAATATD